MPQPHAEPTPQRRPRLVARLLPDSRLDLPLAIALTAGILLTATGPHRPWFVAAALLAGLPLAYRRRWPLLVFAVVLVGVVAAATTADFWPAIGAIVVAAYSVGAYGRSRLQAAAVLAVTATVIALAFGQLPPIPAFLAPYLILGLPWLAGTAIGDRQQRVELLQERATRLEQEQPRAAAAARAAERERIARELHDVIAHSVSVMVVQAGAARQVLPSAPAAANEALLAVEATGRAAMSELRSLLGVLQRPSEVDLAPQPSMGELAALLQRVAEAGLPVSLRVLGRQQPLPPGLDLAAYRIVQEALTNALKYSGLAATEVRLEYRPDALKIEVLDEGVGRPAGLLRASESQGRGITGMRERVAVYGGTLEVGPRLGRGYAVRAWLPLDGRLL